MAQTTVLNPLLTSKVVHQFPLPTWLENLAIRSNGQILTTVTTAPSLYLLDPSTPSPPILLHTFPSIAGLGGIIEVEPDKFYVAGGVFDLSTFTNQSGSYKLWEVDLTNFEETGKAEVKEVMRLEKIGFPNGLELLSRDEKTILAADCEEGKVFKIDVGKGTHEVFVEVEEMKNPENPVIPIAINGLVVREGYLYWTNSSKALFCRIKIGEDGGEMGEVEVLREGLVGDDFCIDGKGDAWITTNPFNTIAVAREKGGVVTVAGKIDTLEVAGATACQFDRRSGKEHMLYVVTNGGLSGPVNGSEVEGGKVLVIDTSSFKA